MTTKSVPIERLRALVSAAVKDRRHSPLWHYMADNYDAIVDMRRSGATWHTLAAGFKGVGLASKKNAVTADTVRRTFASVSKARAARTVVRPVGPEPQRRSIEAPQPRRGLTGLEKTFDDFLNPKD